MPIPESISMPGYTYVRVEEHLGLHRVVASKAGCASITLLLRSISKRQLWSVRQRQRERLVEGAARTGARLHEAGLVQAGAAVRQPC